MKELLTEKYKDIIPLFKEQHFVNRIRSHLERTPVSKKVFVDNIKNPTTAVIYVKPRLMFGGKADNTDFNKEIGKFLYAILKPVLKKENISGIDCYLTNNEWIKNIDSIVEEPIFYNRYYYEISELKQKNWRDFIPEGFSLEPVDFSLLERKHLKNYDWLLEEIEENWKPFEKGLQENRGFYLVKEDKEIVSWCTTEYLTDENEIEVGIATKEEYQKRGFALLVGSATADYCLTKYKTVGWHCTDSNLGSIKTAEKIGYMKKKEYPQVWISFRKKK